MTQQDALAAALESLTAKAAADWHVTRWVEADAPDILAALARDGWVIVNAETLAAALSKVSGEYTGLTDDLAAAILAALRGDTDGDL